MPIDGLGTLGGLTGRLVTLSLLHSIWIGLAAASVAAIALRVLPRRRRGTCHALLLAMLALTVIGPPIATALQRSRAEPRAILAAPISGGSIVVLPGPVLKAPDEDPTPSPAPSLPATTARAIPPPRLGLLADRLASLVETHQPAILLAWLIGVLPLVSIVAVGLIASESRRRAARPASETIQGRADDLSRRLGLRRGLRVLVHPTLSEPCLCGLVRPVVLLPRSWLDGADLSRIDAVLAHELAHHRRLDLPVNLAQRLVEASFFFHPAVLWLSRSLRNHRERCADAMAVSLTANPVALAEALESVARFRISGHRPIPLAERLGGDDLTLLSRVQELLGMTPPRPPFRRWSLVAIPASALVAWLSASIGLAQDPPRSDPPEPTDAPAATSVETPNEPLTPPGALSTAVEAGAPIEVSGRISGVLSGITSLDPHAGAFESKGFEFRLGEGPAVPANWRHQIIYDFRFLSTKVGPWRDRLKKPLQPLGGPHGDSVWLLNEEDRIDLLTVVLEDTSMNLVTAPKVTVFEKHPATIGDITERHYVADVKPIIGEDSVTFDPVHKSEDEGTTIVVSGAFGDGEMTIDFDARFEAIVAMHTLRREVDTPSGKQSAIYQVPVTTDRRLEFSTAIPDGSTLMVKLGVIERPATPTGAAEFAIALFDAVGKTPLQARGTPIELFVLITPRKIVLEVEEEQLGIPAVELPDTPSDTP